MHLLIRQPFFLINDQLRGLELHFPNCKFRSVTSKTNGARISENCYYSLVAEMKRLELYLIYGGSEAQDKWLVFFKKFYREILLLGHKLDQIPPKPGKSWGFSLLLWASFSLLRDQISSVYGFYSSLWWWCSFSSSKPNFKVVICLSSKPKRNGHHHDASLIIIADLRF